MAKKQTAFVVVDREWYDLTMQPLMTGRPSGSAANAHLMIGLARDMNDQRGLWLGKLLSDSVHKKDGTAVEMDLMIPWRYVLGLGIIDESMQFPAGFQGATVLHAGRDET